MSTGKRYLTESSGPGRLYGKVEPLVEIDTCYHFVMNSTLYIISKWHLTNSLLNEVKGLFCNNYYYLYYYYYYYNNNNNILL